MDSSVRRCLVYTFAVLLAGGALAGCADTTGTGEGDPPREQQEGEPPPKNGSIVHVETNDCEAGKTGPEQPCYIESTTGSVYDGLQAKVQDGEGQPSPDRVVNFEIVEQEPEGVVSLGAGRKLTEDNGIAKVELVPSDTETGTARIKASTNNPDLGAVFWEAEISVKGAGKYQVEVNYDGEADLNQTKVLMYKASDYPKDGGCAKIKEQTDIRHEGKSYFVDLPMAFAGPPPEPLQVVEGGNLQRTFSFDTLLDTGEAYTVWAQSYKRQQNDGEPRVVLAWGCETGPEFDELDGGKVTIDLKDHVPRLQEEYAVIHNFDIVDALPDNVERWVRLIGLFVKSPGAFLVGCEQGDTTLNQDGDQIMLCEDGSVPGVLDFLTELDFIPSEIKDYVDEITKSDTARESVREVVDAFIIDKIFNQIGWADAGRTITDDIFTTITNFGVKGKMRFKTQLTPEYGDNGVPQMVLPEEDTSQVWQKFAFHWQYKQGCEDAQDFQSCRTQWFDAQEFLEGEERFVKANFKAMMGGTDKLHIEEHALTINFGALLIGALERVVFPRYFSSVANDEENVVKDVDDNGDGKVTFSELFEGTIIGCKDLADSDTLGTEDGKIEGALETAVKKVCDNLRDTLIDRFKEALKDGLQLDGATITLNTPTEEACTVHQPDSYPGKADDPPQLPYVDRLGEKDAQCKWDVNISFSEDKATGTFYGDTN